MSAPRDTDWIPSTIERLCVLWDEGHSTSEIGRRLGVSKNAVIGKAHRLNLKPRGSPIIRAGERAENRPRVHRPHRAVTTLPPRASAPKLSPIQSASLGRRPPQAPEVSVEQLRLILPVRKIPGAGCQFPMWPHNAKPPSDVTKRFCESATAEQSVYCREHRAVCYRNAEDFSARPIGYSWGRIVFGQTLVDA